MANDQKEAFLRSWFDVPEGVHWAHGMSNEVEKEVSESFDRAIAALNTRPAAPVEGLDTVNPIYSSSSHICLPKGDYVTRSQAEAIIAAKVEHERLRFEGDLDKWMKTIGAGITGYQPEAYALMDLACQELVKLRTDNAALTARVADLEEGRAEFANHYLEENAALTARVKELERVSAYEIDVAQAEIDGRKALGTQLTAAKKALEEADEALQADAIASAHAAIRAVLGGKP